MIQQVGFQMKPNMNLLSDRNHQTVLKNVTSEVKRSDSTQKNVMPPPQDILIS